jgi:2-methylcitrate dehydratase PrpD
MIGVKIAYKDVEWETVEENKIEVVEEKIETEEEINLTRDYPLWEKLPYSGDGFTVERYEGELTLVVENRNEEVLETIKEINSWFLENNIATDSHRLIITNQIEN